MSLFVTRAARERLGLDPHRFGSSGRLSLDSFAAAYALADALRWEDEASGERSLEGHDLAALDLLQDLAADLIDRTVEEHDAELLERGAERLARHLDSGGSKERLWGLADELGVVERDAVPPEGSAAARRLREDCTRELLVAAVLSEHPLAKRILGHLGLGRAAAPELAEAVDFLGEFLQQQEFVAAGEGRLSQSLGLLASGAPDSLREPIETICQWGPWRRAEQGRLAAVSGLLAEAATHRGGPGHDADPGIGLDDGPATYSADVHWMPDLVLLAKNVLVWLDQLSRRHHRPIERLDEIPVSDLEEIARRGFTGLWLIGVWERSEASERLKRAQGQVEAVASAYSVKRYRIAAELGGEAALERLAERALQLGIRLAADFVPNHTAIDSEWVLHHPERFISVDEPPFPSYSFSGEQLSPEPGVSIRVEDHYWDRSDAAVVFERADRDTGNVRYICHGNDGTSIPWNDTAQLDYLNPATREAVIETILDVAKRFPILRFDAAMTLTRQHFHRLWYPAAAAAGAIPSRAEHGLSTEEMMRRMPQEFWRQVVERLQSEAPGTLLLAEAFWLMEGYFVRRLGLHRVYNSAFMHMLRDGETPKLRQLLADTLAVDARLLGRFVNYLSNPDEETAVVQFGRDERYIGTCRVLATLPGLPLFAHGQWEGLAEKYGMEFCRARTEETPDEQLIARHDREIAPILARRDLFSGVERFRLLRLESGGYTMDCVLAYANEGENEAVVVAFNNSDHPVAGRLLELVAGDGSSWDWGCFAAGAGDGRRVLRDLAGSRRVAFDPGQLRVDGLALDLGAYECVVLTAPSRARD